MLNKTSRPVKVPIPTIFKNNIDQFLRHKNNNTDEMLTSSADQTLSQLSAIDTINGGAELDSVQILDDDCMYLGKAQEYDIDGMEAYCLATSNAQDEGPIQIYRSNDVDFMMEERLDDDEPVDDIYDEFDGDVKHSIICDTVDNVIDLENVCRLCADTVSSDGDMVDLFTTSLSHSLEQINKILPKQVRKYMQLCEESKLKLKTKIHSIIYTDSPRRCYTAATDMFRLYE